jgi:hypothetical protein
VSGRKGTGKGRSVAPLDPETGEVVAWWRPPQPFEPGNVASLRHGAFSPRVVQPVADQIAAQLPSVAPWAGGAAFAATVASWAHAEAQAAILRAFLDEHGLLDDDGEPRPATVLLERVEGRAAKLRTELGLTPLALVRLLGGLSGVDAEAASSGLAALKAQGRQIRQAAIDGGDDDE